MMKSRKQIPGSDKRMLPRAKVAGRLDPNERIEITVLVSRRSTRTGDGEPGQTAMLLGTCLPEQRRYLSREELAAARGADPEDMEKIHASRHEHNLIVVQTSIP